MAVRGIPHPSSSSAVVSRTRVLDLAPALRFAIAYGVLEIGLLAVAGLGTASSACWLIWLAIGAVAGAIARSVRAAWLVVLATGNMYAAILLLGATALEPEPQAWLLLLLVGTLIVGAGFGLATLVVGPVSTGSVAASRRPARSLAARTITLGVLGVVAWSAYSGFVGSTEMIEAPGEFSGCANPASRFGWAYEAVNYDIGDDARLMAENEDPSNCSSQGARAGSAVVTSDGIPIAAFYIPAASGADATAPTIVIAPGWKSNKSQILKYAPFFHDRFNLVLVDLRNGGRSGGDTTTWGATEKEDIRAVVDWLEREKHPAWIGGMGDSMGAATLTAAAADDPRIRALILDSMHASIVATFGDGLAYERNLPGYPTAWTMTWLASQRAGVPLQDVDPQRQIARLGDRPVLLIQGSADGLDTIEHAATPNLQAALDAGVPAALQICEGGTHGRLVERCGPEWQAWVDEFLGGLPELQAARR